MYETPEFFFNLSVFFQTLTFCFPNFFCSQGEMWIMGFHAPTTFVKQLRKELSEDHRIIRQLVLKETRWPRLYYFSAEALQGVLAAQKTPEEFNLETGYYLEDNEEEDSDSSDSDSDSDSE